MPVRQSPGEVYRDEGGEETSGLKDKGKADGNEGVDTSSDDTVEKELFEHLSGGFIEMETEDSVFVAEADTKLLEDVLASKKIEPDT